MLADAGVLEFGVEHKDNEDPLVTGASDGGVNFDGEPGLRTLGLKPPRFLSLAARRLSIFRTSLFRPIEDNILHYTERVGRVPIPTKFPPFRFCT